ncbi:MAG TPA: hypothetical protein VGA67_05575, partial [Candidatus Dojkabacteria bacterium]
MSVKQPLCFLKSRGWLLILTVLSFLIVSNPVSANDQENSKQILVETDKTKYKKPSKIEIGDNTGKFDKEMIKGLEKFYKGQSTPLINKENTFRVVNAEGNSNWITASVVLLEINLEENSTHDYNWDSFIVGKKEGNQWEFAKIYSPRFQEFMNDLPEEVMSKEAKVLVSNQRLPANSFTTASSQVNHKFPWPKGEQRQWWKRGGDPWHQDGTGKKIDFGSSSNSRVFVASETAIITNVCTATLTQDVQLKFADGSKIYYRHFEKGTLENNISLNNVINKGQKIGVVKPGDFH